MGKPVTQEDAAGCAIACVAFVCGVSYRTAKRQFKGMGSPKTGYFCFHITKALSRLGRRYDYKKVRGRQRFEEGSIVFAERSDAYPLGHFLVRHGSKWMNPWINFPKMNGARSGFVSKLPSKPSYVVFPVE